MIENIDEKTTSKTNLNSPQNRGVNCDAIKMQTVGEALGPDFLIRAMMPNVPPLSGPPNVSLETVAAIRAGIKEMIREVVREELAREKNEANQNG